MDRKTEFKLQVRRHLEISEMNQTESNALTVLMAEFSEMLDRKDGTNYEVISFHSSLQERLERLKANVEESLRIKARLETLLREIEQEDASD